MSKQYVNFGAGWFKTSQKGEEFLSCKVGSKTNPIKLQAVLPSGEVVAIESFAAFLNKNKKNETHPDFNFSFTVE